MAYKADCFILDVQLSGAAFDDTPATELARILRRVAQRVEEGQLGAAREPQWVFDVNGNSCGHFKLITRRERG